MPAEPLRPPLITSTISQHKQYSYVDLARPLILTGTKPDTLPNSDFLWLEQRNEYRRPLWKLTAQQFHLVAQRYLLTDLFQNLINLLVKHRSLVLRR